MNSIRSGPIGFGPWIPASKFELQTRPRGTNPDPKIPNPQLSETSPCDKFPSPSEFAKLPLPPQTKKEKIIKKHFLIKGLTLNFVKSFTTSIFSTKTFLWMTHVTRNSLTNYSMTNIRMTHLSIRSLSFINVVLVHNLRNGGSKSFFEKIRGILMTQRPGLYSMSHTV